MTREYKIKEGHSFVLPGGDVLEAGQVIRLGDDDAKQHAAKLENPPAEEAAANTALAVATKSTKKK